MLIVQGVSPLGARRRQTMVGWGEGKQAIL